MQKNKTKILQTDVIYNQCCLEGMQAIPDESIDMILTDLPYGTTAAEWDSIIPFAPLWSEWERIIKPHGAIVLFASQPFTSMLVCSNIRKYRHSWIWEKEQGPNFLNCNREPMMLHEDIVVFSKESPNYYPQELIPFGKKKSNRKKRSDLHAGAIVGEGYVQKWSNYPKSIIMCSRERGLHNVQKPVPLLEYLIKTYSQEGEIILDATIGSGSTAIAAINTNRRYIGFEKDKEIFNTCMDRLNGKNQKLAS